MRALVRLSSSVIGSLLFIGCTDAAEKGTLTAPAVVVQKAIEVDATITTWDTLSDEALWASIQKADRVADVGLKIPGTRYGMERGRVLVSKSDRGDLLRRILEDRDVELIYADTLLPIVSVRLKSQRAMAMLRRSPFTSYVEPGKFVDVETSPWAESGCSTGLYAGPGGSTYITPGDLLPWNYGRMNIDRAWQRSIGQGALVGLIDTGVSALSGEVSMPTFAGGIPGKTITLDYTAGGSGSDDCGHGTKMAGVIAAPRDGSLIVGVAYGASVYSVRVDNDVLLTNNTATRLGIRRASDAGARIISMAFGSPNTYSSIADEIDWVVFNRDAILFGAAGTGSCINAPYTPVVFPARLSTVIAVTALDQSGSVACNAHRGPEVEFTAYATQPVGLFVSGTFASLGGSSNATGVLSGMAALILAQNPALTRAQILARLRRAASPTGYRWPNIGYGTPDAFCAVGGMCYAWVDGTALIEHTGNFTFTANQLDSGGPFQYQWSTGETTQSISRHIYITYGMQEYNMELSVTITDLSDGSQKSVNKSVVVRQPNNTCPTCF